MTLFGYIRTSRHLQEGVAGMDPFSQELRLRESGVQRSVPVVIIMSDITAFAASSRPG